MSACRLACQDGRMTWWQTLLTATAPAAVAAIALLAQQSITARTAGAAARLEAARTWHDRRFALVTECIELMNRFERTIVDVGRLEQTVSTLRSKIAQKPQGEAAWGLEEDIAQVNQRLAAHDELVERVFTMKTSLAFVVSEPAADRFAEYAQLADQYLKVTDASESKAPARSQIADALAEARRRFIEQSRVDSAAPATPRRRVVATALAQLRRRAAAARPSAAGRPGSP